MHEEEDRYNEEENFEPCISKYKEMLKNNASYFFDVEEFESIADYFLDEGNTNGAVDALKYGITLHPLSSSLLLRSAQIFASIGKLKSAHDHLDKAESLDGEDEETYITRASLFSQEHNYKKAIEYFLLALETAEDFKEDILIDLAFEYENAEQYEDAIECLKKVLNSNPENEAAIYELVFCYGQLDKTEDSIDYLQNFLNNHPYSFTAWYNLGNAFSSIEFHEKAIFAYEYCALIDESFSSAYFNAANSFVALKKYAEAIKLYKETFNHEDPQAITYNYIGECYEKLEEYVKAENCFKKALEIDNDFSDAWIGLAIAKDNLNLEKEALGLIEQAINLKPENAEYWHIYAESLDKNNRKEDAEIAFKKAFEFAPTNHQLIVDYADFLIDFDSLENAIKYLTDLNESLITFTSEYRLAALLLKNGQEQDALSHLENALKLDKNEVKLLTEYYKEALSFDAVIELINQYK